MNILRAALLITVLLGTNGHLWAAESFLTPPGSNTGITVENSVTIKGETRVFFVTWPNLGDPLSGKDCAMNYYSVSAVPGAPARPVAEEVCSGLIQKSRLLDDGSALIVSSRWLERWKDGERLEKYPFKVLPTITRQGIVNDMGGPDRLGISSKGHVVAVVQEGSDRFVVVALTPAGEEGWRQAVQTDGGAAMFMRVEPAADGGAVVVMTTSGLSAENTFLHVFDPAGALKSIDLTGNGKSMQPEDLENMSPAEMQHFFSRMGNQESSKVEQIAVKARPQGGFDAVYELQGGGPGSDGVYLLRLSPAGEVETTHFLGPLMQQIGMDEWADVSVAEGSLWLSGRVLATQQGVNSRRSRYMQNVVAQVELEFGRVTSRLIPLDRRYLEAAMNAGDAELQYLPGLPGGTPELLAVDGERAVNVAVGTVARRSVLRIDEVSEDLPAWSPSLDQRRQAEQKAQNRPSQADQAAAMQELMQGMTDGSFLEMQIAEMEKMMNDPNISAAQRERYETVIEELRSSLPANN